MKKLNYVEVEDFTEEIYRILKEIPVDYCRRILERSYEYRRRYDEPELDYSSEEELDEPTSKNSYETDED